MSTHEPDDPEGKPQVDAAHDGVIMWVLTKDANLLRCELNNSRAGGWEMRIFEDGELCFAQSWPLEGPARFYATSLKRERLRNGWTELPLTMAASGKTASITDDLTFLARNDCVYMLDLRCNLNDALNVMGSSTDYQVINTDALPSADVRKGYPSPTILWRGKEIFGLPVPTPPFRLC
jgi:hypothetical protein